MSTESIPPRYAVVHNDEEQYSTWPTDLPVPNGWYADGFTGSRQECLEHVGRVWTDLRPKTLRDLAGR
ncbi:MbtH family protein [Actinoplanes xinjiangensis]|jgi:MbtH protein|uniref:MbtH protein n=1 Tax=Actinoplanes xinjiangensis TaxID=512350 RepID=A0A316G089_9ACTN|nr:MbtH family NRPS accessory protein [Actinoplanes xinjiangensis]PWK47757.1 MbtH protein [Actinoplanes xinjiangensis]GIF39309.1 MbtH protein [Actinoplanes xinjiangensis]